MRVDELMSRDVVTIDPTESCLEAVTRMCRSRIRHLPVIDRGGELAGIVTDRDLRHLLFSPGVFPRLGVAPTEALLRETRVDAVMSSPVLTIERQAGLEDAARLLRAHRVGALPVVDGACLVGIVTEIDLLRHIAGLDQPDVSYPAELEVVVSYP